MGERGTERWRVKGIEVELERELDDLRGLVGEQLGLPAEELAAARLIRRSIDLRGRARGRAPRQSLQLEFELAGRPSSRLRKLERSGRIHLAPPREGLARGGELSKGGAKRRAVVVGAGPAGTFAALVLALEGAEVHVLERGGVIETRSRDVVRFHRSRVPDPESNLLFGEGGAGTYSDGKLYTRVDDPLEVEVLREFVRAGAREDILWDARAHIGTDRLHRVLPALRARLEELGVRFHFGVRMEELVLDGGAVRAVRTQVGELPCDALVLALGHSAEDTWRVLAAQGVALEARPFQLGIRVEHPQALIDAGRHGEWAAKLGAASYNLTCKASSEGPGAHSFCMCPGGKIVASVNTPGLVCTNGMSNSTHSSPWANSALVTTYGPDDFGEGPFAALEFRRELERRAFEAGGGDYTAPAQRVPDFLAGVESRGVQRSSYTFGVVPGRLDRLLPERGYRALARALSRFEELLPGFAGPEGLLVGIESRSSCPVRLPRDRESRRARGLCNLWPAGEGAGYAGGIMSAALDGVRCAQAAVRALREAAG